MKIFDTNKSFNQYVIRIISIMLALVVGGLFTLAYIAVNSLAVRNKQNESEMLMEQAEGNINSAIASIRNYLQYAYNSDEVYNVILSPNENLMQVSSSINKIYDDFTVFVPKLHSLQFYNENTDAFYSRSVVPMAEKSVQAKEISGIDLMFKSTVVMRSVKMYDGTYDSVVSYIFSDYNSGSKDSSYIAVNIYASWLKDMVQVDHISGVKNFIIQPDETAKIKSDENKFLAEFLLKNPPEDKFSIVKTRLNGTKYLVASKKIDSIEGCIIKMYPYKEVYKPIEMLRFIIVLMAVLSEIVVLFAGFRVSKHLYSPIDDLYKDICKETNKSQNEIEQIRNVFRMIEYKKEFDREQYLRAREIGRLLSSENVLDRKEIVQILEKNGISAEPEILTVCAFEIADYDDFAAQNSNRDVKAILYGIYNIANELISESYVCCGVISDNGLIQFIIEQKKDEYNPQENLKNICIMVSDAMKNHFNMDVNSCIGDEITDVTKISDEMFKTLKSFVYTYNYGYGCCITPNMIQENINNIHGVSKTSIEQLKYAIASNDINKITANTYSVFNEIKKLEYFTERSEITLLVKIIEDELEKLSHKTTSEVLSWREILQQKYIDDAEKMLLSNMTNVINEVTKVKDDMMNKKNTEIVREAERIIREEYADSNLCMSYIANKLSVGYRLLGSMFAEEYGMPVTKYINKVRLEKSIELLREGNMSVLQISRECGYESEAYYYRVFKKMFGMTPKQYSSMLK